MDPKEWVHNGVNILNTTEAVKMVNFMRVFFFATFLLIAAALIHGYVFFFFNEWR